MVVIREADLPESPVLNLKYGEAGLLIEQNEVRFAPLDIRCVPGRELIVGQSHLLKKPVELPLSFCRETLDIFRYHRGHFENTPHGRTPFTLLPDDTESGLLTLSSFRVL